MKHLLAISSLVGILALPLPAFADTDSANDSAFGSILDLFYSVIRFNHERINSLFGGNGKGGPFVVESVVDLASYQPDDLNFTDVVIHSGAILNVPAGTTIRCSGSFSNFGKINVEHGAKLLAARRVNLSQGLMSSVHPGDSYAAPNSGMYTSGPIDFMDGGRGGDPIPRAAATTSFNRFRIGGGAGGGFADGGVAYSSAGGGLLRIHCRGPVYNQGFILADANAAQTGTGGGGGGIVILASQNLVDNSAGVISATGSDGGRDFTCCAPGGGGGGGIVVLAAPNIVTGGIIDVSGGAGVTPVNTASQTTVSSGGGGGASGGRGGRGGGISPGGRLGGSGAGEDGYLLLLRNDPAAMLH